MNNSIIARSCITCGSDNLSSSSAILSPFMVKRMFDWDVRLISEDDGLYDIKSGTTHCPCKSMYCHDCGTLFLDLRPGDIDMQIYYNGYQTKEFFDMRIEYEPSFKQRLSKVVKGSGDITDGKFVHFDKVENFIAANTDLTDKSSISICDVGGDGGINTPFGELESSQVVISDINLEITRTANTPKNVENHMGFDLITMRHVIEHVSYPLDLISSHCKNLKKGGYLYIEVPLEAIMQIHTQPSPNKNDYPKKLLWNEHINFFSLTSFIHMANKIDFEHVDTQLLEISSGTLVESPRTHIMTLFQKKH